ncbi:MAG TPA: prepilin-type N-terminal cleavage/methylation domain-containing protein [Opitutaceae bacterium]|nr:prepilin-type N-terminal cleavage/methylation domain-containing protein [Opitutaceae bacterium]
MISTSRNSGFTLVELITAMGVTAVLSALMLGLASQLLSIWRRETGVLSTRAQADLVFEQLSRDLEALVMRRDGNVWFAATVQPSPQIGRGDSTMSDAEWEGRVKPGNELPGTPGSSLSLEPTSGSLADMRFGQAGVWLRFFSIVPDTQTSLSNLSAPRAVAYQLVRRRVTASASARGRATAPFRYTLYRSSARPMSPSWPDENSTFAVGYDLFSAASNPHYNRGDSSVIDHVGNIRAPRRYEQILGNNVIDFGVRCWGRDSTGRWSPLFPAPSISRSGTLGLGFAATTRDGLHREYAIPPSSGTSTPLSAEAIRYGFPEQVDIFIRILTEEGAQKIEAFETGRIVSPFGEGTDAEAWWRIALQHSHVFVHTVRVQAQPF